MKIKHINDINEAGDEIIMVYDFDTTEAQAFGEQLLKLGSGEQQEIDIREIEFINLENCGLKLRIADIDTGIHPEEDSGSNFICELTRSSYSAMAELVKAYDAENNTGSHWLYNIDTPIDFLFSSGGTW